MNRAEEAKQKYEQSIPPRSNSMLEGNLTQFARALMDNVMNSDAIIPRSTIRNYDVLVGPRAGNVYLECGKLVAGKLIKALGANNSSHVQQLARPCLGRMVQTPQVYMEDALVVISIVWPDTWANKAVTLGDWRNLIGNRPMAEGAYWVAGIDERGDIVVPHLGPNSEHLLIAGKTGSGKTSALLGLGWQLSGCKFHRITLIDGKAGAALGPLNNLPNVMAKSTGTMEGARARIGWHVAEMERRYAEEPRVNGIFGSTRHFLFIDEFGDFLQEDEYCARGVCRLTKKGREAGIHVILSAVQPNVKAFGVDGEATRRQCDTRIALRVTESDISAMVLGKDCGSRRADHLAGKGDAYIRAAGRFVRTQLAHVRPEDVPQEKPDYEFPDGFPLLDSEDIEESNSKWRVTARQMAEAVKLGFPNAKGKRNGRPSYLSRMKAIEQPIGSDKADDLMTYSREVHKYLQEIEYCKGGVS